MLDTASSPSPIHDVLIIGTGFAGLCMAIKLRAAGIEDLVLLERAGEIGGTWRDNHYPGCACDVPSLLYSYSFAPKPDWSRAFAPHDEIQAYLLDCVDRFELRPSIVLDAELVRAEYDEATAIWSVETRDGRRWRARALVSAIGALSDPAIPEIDGLEDFEGARFHSARWDHDFELEGKRVAVIGTGASAIQFVPQIAPKVARLDLYQRTPPWILPKQDRPFSALEQAAHARFPKLQAARRALVYWQLEARVLGFTRYPAILRAAQGMAEAHIRRQIKDPKLRAKVTPDYTMGCKRILLSNDYYPALTRPEVDVLTTGVESITATGVVDGEGREREVDAIIFGTGFRVQELAPPGLFIGRGGLDLAERWRERPEAYKGTTIPEFPNLFVLTGPNTGLGHSSMIYIIESQVAYVVDALRKLRERGWASVEVREDALRRFNDELQRKSDDAVWLSGCRSWYLDDAGRNTALWPDFTFRFRRATAAFDEGAYRIRARGELEPGDAELEGAA